mgnify:CR=1 FL=1
MGCIPSKALLNSSITVEDDPEAAVTKDRAAAESSAADPSSHEDTDLGDEYAMNGEPIPPTTFQVQDPSVLSYTNASRFAALLKQVSWKGAGLTQQDCATMFAACTHAGRSGVHQGLPCRCQRAGAWI